MSLAAAEGERDAALADLTVALADLTTTQGALTTAQAARATAEAAQATAEGERDAAQAAQATAETALATANGQVTTLTGERDAAQTAQATAQAAQATAEGERDTAQAALTAAQAALATAEGERNAALTDLTTTQGALTTAEAAQAAAQLAQATAQAAQATAEGERDAAQAAQATAELAQATAEGERDTAQAAQATAEAAIATASLDLEVANARIVELESLTGCTDPEASNYSVDAVYDDGSCEYPGCTNPSALNYNPNANVDDGSCQIPGCTDAEALNYNAEATQDDSSCEYAGCTNPDASNYNPNATVDDDSCNDVLGCMNPDASNYNPNATVDDDSCNDVLGCMNPDASNYNPNATVDDGGCVEGIPDGFTFVAENAQGYDEYTHDETGIKFVLLPGGEFEMGSPDTEFGRDSDEAKHTVKLSSFLIAKYEVTQAEYAAVMTGNTAGLNATPSANFGDAAASDQRPVESVSWDELKAADGFLARTGLSLPSEAQWEYACRAGTSGPYAGNGVLDDMGWYAGNSGGSTHDVGTKQANDFGLHDMHGNVFEWCEDVYNESFFGPSEFGYGPDPVAIWGSGDRVFRGGSVTFFPFFAGAAIDCRSADRRPVPVAFPGGRGDPGSAWPVGGFRPARPLVSTESIWWHRFNTLSSDGVWHEGSQTFTLTSSREFTAGDNPLVIPATSTLVVPSGVELTVARLDVEGTLIVNSGGSIISPPQSLINVIGGRFEINGHFAIDGYVEFSGSYAFIPGPESVIVQNGPNFGPGTVTCPGLPILFWSGCVRCDPPAFWDGESCVAE